MDKIIRQSKLGNYTILYLEPDPKRYLRRYYKYKIRGKEYEPVITYDSPNTIAIVSDEEDFVGEIVEYV